MIETGAGERRRDAAIALLARHADDLIPLSVGN